MDRRNTMISLALAMICAGILAVFTDLELTLVRWVNCGPLASAEAKSERRCD